VADGAARTIASAAVLACLIGEVTGCGASPGAVRTEWRPVADSALVGATGGRPFVATVAASPTGSGWLAGGVVLGPGDDRQVAVWGSAGNGRVWTRAPKQPIAGRDGPNETIYFLAGGASGQVAFGYRRSPTENYPRPSAWVAPDTPGAPWQEVLEDRELFGGPNIVGFGGLTFGPHGYAVSGTWTGGTGGAVVSVWRSPDGRTWTHDTGDPAFQPRAGLVPFATGISDGPAGILLAATAEAPTPSDPTREGGELWYSGTGQTWSRLTGTLAGASSTFDAVQSAAGEWLVAGTSGRDGSARPAVWEVGTSGRMSPPELLPDTSGRTAHPSSIAVTGRKVFVAGRDGDRPVVWLADDVAGRTDHWREVAAPPPAAFPLDSVRVAATSDGLLLTLVGSDRSAVWYAAPPG
jgi:hypothetical protein